jgi:hypothetical protein
MKLRFKSFSLYEFYQKFPDDIACLAYSVEQRWKHGFNCTKCGHKNYCIAIKEHDRQYTSCRKRTHLLSECYFSVSSFLF